MLFSPWVLKKKGLLLSLLGGILALLTVCGGRLTPEVSIVLARGFGLGLIRLARSRRVAGDVLSGSACPVGIPLSCGIDVAQHAIRAKEGSRMKSSSSRGRKNGSGGRTGSNFAGIHHRRDKRFPLQSGQSAVDVEAAHDFDSEQTNQAGIGGDNVDAEWNEALMLWLSWNSTYEKVTAKMCKPGQNATKLERLMDEMDQLRSRAIETTERLLETEEMAI